MKKIGIIGSGPVAQALAAGFLTYNYPVMMGTRHPEKLNDWVEREGKGASVGSFDEVASFGEIIVLAVKGSVAKDALDQAGKKNLVGKTVIDTTNPIADLPPENGVLRFFTNLDYSLMEQLQKSFPDTHFVKAFNSVGNAVMVNPSFESKPTMFICGNDKSAKQDVAAILDQFGYEAADMGGVEAARAIEPLCMLWCIPGFLEDNWTHAFKLLKK